MDDHVRETPWTVTAVDGYLLHGSLYAAAGDHNPANAIIFNSGGGASYRRYRHFLRFLGAAGLPTLAYDYRGVGLSAHRKDRRFDAGIDDWAELDQAAVIDAARERFPRARLSSISHSIGCLVAAGAPNASLLEQMVFVAPHTGYWRDYGEPWRIPMTLMWHAFMPVLAQIVGYFPASRLGLGDDFPKRVAMQWAGRTRAEFRFGAFGQSNGIREYIFAQRVQTIDRVALVIVPDRDAFATERAVRRFLTTAAELRTVRRDLVSSTGSPLGHWGFFRRRNCVHWPIVPAFIAPSVPRIRLDPEWSTD